VREGGSSEQERAREEVAEFHGLMDSFADSFIHSFVRLHILVFSCDFIGIAATFCPLIDAPHSHQSSIPPGFSQTFLIVIVFAEKFRPGGAGHYLVCYVVGDFSHGG